ncbi:MAG: threonine synthase [Tissierellales bacterium]|nr:threonine synthase [Tissierellales bacterium]
MRYISTRDKTNIVSSSKAIIQGIAEDGGLFVPEEFRKIENLDSFIGYSYNRLCKYILNYFFDDMKYGIDEAVDRAYDAKFKDRVIELKDFGDIGFLELYHGVSLSFKDIALSILPELMKLAMEIEKTEEDILILTATSGDTGKAALEGFKDLERFKIAVFFPDDGVSFIQEKQMITQEGKNTYVFRLLGNFDDAQRGVKKLFSDKEFIEELNKMNLKLSSANSINIARLIPQVVYYVYTYLESLRKGKLSKADKINFCVPTGNFGNVLAAYYAYKIGVPINKLIIASNENNVLTDFFRTKKYNANRNLVKTISPSMDILVSSNLERLLFDLTNDDKLIKDKMKELFEVGSYSINIQSDLFFADYIKQEETKNNIRIVFDKYNYIIDPHTAVAYGVYQKYLNETKDKTYTVIVSTASPYKFPNEIMDAFKITYKDEIDSINKLSILSGNEIPKQIMDILNNHKSKEIVVSKDNMKEKLLNTIKQGGSNV